MHNAGTTSPGKIDGINDAMSAVAGDGVAVALKSDGTVWAWGDNWRGKLGNGSKNYHVMPSDLVMTPIQVPGLSSVVAIDAGVEHSVALLADGSVVAWGGNELGQIGDGTKDDRSSPVLFPVPNVVKVSAAALDMMVLDTYGNIWVSGNNIWGQVGNNSYTAHQITRYPADVVSPVIVDFSAYFGPPVVAGKGNDNVSTPTPVPEDTTRPTASPSESNDGVGTPTPLQDDGGNMSLLIFATAGIAAAIIAFFVYWAIKK
jgi:hypothetical protein